MMTVMMQVMMVMLLMMGYAIAANPHLERWRRVASLGDPGLPHMHTYIDAVMS